MVPLAWWCPLLSGVADSGAFQNRCIYSALRKYSPSWRSSYFVALQPGNKIDVLLCRATFCSNYSWAALSWQVCCGAIFFPFFNDGLKWFSVGSYGYPFITNPDLSFSTTLSLTCVASSLVFMAPLAWWCPLLSGVADSGTISEQVYIY